MVLYLVSAWLLAQIADVVIGLGGLPDSVGRFVLVILTAGLPVAIGLAWMFEWTPQGIRREDAADSPSTVAPGGQNRQIDYVIIALLSVAVVYFAIKYDWRGRAAPAAASIAVLPFENRSVSPDDVYFADGIHDDLLTHLAKISSLVVISRTSVMRYRDTAKSIPEIADELGVATVLEGSVQRAGERIRINLKLVDAASDRNLWAESYDRALTAENIFSIQAEIATTIAATLQAKLLPAEVRRLASVPTTNFEAYEAYLFGRRDTATRDDDALLKAVAWYRKAIELDPEFALAWAGLAEALVLLDAYGSALELPERLLDEAEQAARRALELDPQLGEAHTAMGIVLDSRGEPQELFAGFLERGVLLAPGSADARRWYARYLGDSMRYEEALEQLEKAVELDPMSAIVRVNYAATLRELGREAEARAENERALEIDPTFRPALFSTDTLSDAVEALVNYSSRWTGGRNDGWFLLDFVFNYLELDDVDRASQWADEVHRVQPDSVPDLIAHLNVSLARQDVEPMRSYAQRLLPFERPDLAVPSRVLLNDDLRGGELAAPRQRYAQKYPDLLRPEVVVGSNYPAAVDVAMLLRAEGDDAGARRLLGSALEYMRSLKQSDVIDFGIHEARALAILGDTDAALAALQRAIDSGWRFQWNYFLRQERAFADIRKEPRFTELLSFLESEADVKRARVRELEASGRIVVPQPTGH
ncbi:MAG: hypothetical protein R3358_10170 [Woeseiaceae bacterium]|nr:hypothetical protein [Woeseiaceae bacterium]